MDDQQNLTSHQPLQPQVVEDKQPERSDLVETTTDQPGTTTTTAGAQPGPEVATPAVGSEVTADSGVSEVAAPAPAAEPPVAPESKIARPKPQGPSFFGYKPPKWAHDFDYVRVNKGKGKPEDAKTWLLHTVDRLLKVHSV